MVARERAGVRLRVLEAATGRTLLLRPGGAELADQSFTADGEQLAWRDRRGRIRIADVRSGAVRVLPGWSTPSGGPVSFSPDGSRLASATTEGVTILDATTGWGPSWTAAAGPVQGVDEVRWSPDGRALAYFAEFELRSGDSPIVLMVLDAAGAAPPRTVVPRRLALMYGLRWSPGGERLAFGAYPWGD